MRLYVREETATGYEYKPANKAEIHAGAMAIARLQHLKPTISSASALMQYLQLEMSLLETEQFRVLFLANNNKIKFEQVLSAGIEDQTSVYPKQVVREALLGHATGIIAVHNHPTGQTTPSSADKTITKKLADACEALDIRFLDHVIIGSEGKGYFSFRENGLI